MRPFRGYTNRQPYVLTLNGATDVAMVPAPMIPDRQSVVGIDKLLLNLTTKTGAVLSIRKAGAVEELNGRIDYEGTAGRFNVGVNSTKLSHLQIGDRIQFTAGLAAGNLNKPATVIACTSRGFTAIRDDATAGTSEASVDFDLEHVAITLDAAAYTDPVIELDLVGSPGKAPVIRTAGGGPAGTVTVVYHTEAATQVSKPF